MLYSKRAKFTRSQDQEQACQIQSECGVYIQTSEILKENNVPKKAKQIIHQAIVRSLEVNAGL